MVSRNENPIKDDGNGYYCKSLDSILEERMNDKYFAGATSRMPEISHYTQVDLSVYLLYNIMGQTYIANDSTFILDVEKFANKLNCDEDINAKINSMKIAK